MSQPQFSHSGNDLNSRYRSCLHNFHGIAFEGSVYAPLMFIPRVLLATILPDVQTGLHFFVNKIKPACSFSTLQQWFEQKFLREEKNVIRPVQGFCPALSQ